MKKEAHKNVVPLAGFIITFLGAVLFSTKAIIVKRAFADLAVPALTLLSMRMLFSLPFYLVAAAVNSGKKTNTVFTKREWLYVCLIGLTGYYVSSLLDFMGLQYVSAGIERLILFLYPTFAVLINAYWFKQQITKSQKIALLLAYTGIAIAYFAEFKLDEANPNFLYGSFLIFICAVTYSLYLVGSGRLIPKVGASKFTAYTMLASTVGVLLHFVIASDYRDVEWSQTFIAYGFLLAIVATVIPSFLLSYGMKKIGSNNTAIMTSIGPVSTILQAHWFLGEKIFTEQIIGTMFVVAGVIIIGWKREAATLPVE